jgi:hypothetical protein
VPDPNGRQTSRRLKCATFWTSPGDPRPGSAPGIPSTATRRLHVCGFCSQWPKVVLTLGSSAA